MSRVSGDGVRFEVPVDSVAGVLAAAAAGAARVELGCALFEGGLTPSAGLIRAAVRAVGEARADVEIHVLIRPRGGDFLYDAHEIAAMESDVELAARAGADGVVVGVLTADGDIDEAVTRRLVAAAGGLPVSYHRAFDVARDPFAALETLVGLGIGRMLSSGQAATALEGVELLAALVERAGERITVMPGGGVNERNVARVVRESGAREVHFSGSGVAPSRMRFVRRGVPMGGALRQDEFAVRVTDADRLRAIAEAVGRG